MYTLLAHFFEKFRESNVFNKEISFLHILVIRRRERKTIIFSIGKEFYSQNYSFPTGREFYSQNYSFPAGKEWFFFPGRERIISTLL